MSLINQMLQDLELRRVQPNKAASVDVLKDLVWPGTAAPPERAIPPRLVWGISLAIFGVVAVLLWHFLSADRAPLTPGPVAVTPAAPPAAVAPATAPPPPTTAPVEPPPVPSASPAPPPESPAANPTLAAAPATLEPATAEPPQSDLTEANPADSAAEPVPLMKVDPAPAAPVVNNNGTAQIARMRSLVQPDHTRLIFDADRALRYHLTELTNPDRLVLDLEDAALAQPLKPAELNRGFVSHIQSESYDKGLRVTLDLKTAVKAKAFTLPPHQNYNHRLVIDLYPSASTGAAAAPAKAAELPAAEAKTAVAPEQEQPGPTADVPKVTINKKLRNPTPRDLAEQSYQEALNLLQVGQGGGGENLLRQALTHDAQYAQARETLADLLVESGRFDEAAALLDEGIKFAPHNTALIRRYARVQVEQSNISGAIATLEKEQPAVTTDADYQAFLAALYQRVQRHDEAVQTYQRALTQQPRQGVWWMGLGISLEATGKRSDARQAYQRALESQTLTTTLQDYVNGRLRALQASAS